jgi:amidophosphoribosyltransferase
MADAADVLSAEADDHFHDECGVFGIFGRQDAAAIVTLGLHALQHRGQEAAGIVAFDGKPVPFRTPCLGLVGDTFTRREVIERLPGTAPSATPATRHDGRNHSAQRPAAVSPNSNAGGFAVAHNGNLTNGLTLRRELLKPTAR